MSDDDRKPEERKVPGKRRLADFGTIDAELSNLPDEQALSAPEGLVSSNPMGSFSTIDPNSLNVPAETPQRPEAESRSANDPETADPNVFELVGGDETEGTDEPPAPPPVRPRPTERGAKSKPAETPPEPRVDEVWSRGKEWGPTLLVLGAVVAATLLFVYFAFAAGQWGFAFLLLLLGGAAFLIFSYPIVVTLERPVRMTPEQAVRDYYAALSHHRPHFRRMWLLLSTHGRSSTQFGSFEGFFACWKRWLQGLRGPDTSSMTPLHFEIVNVKADKSAGQTAVKIDYRIRVFLRGSRNGDPLASYSVRQWAVRGPDGMWYLEDGTPPSSPDQPAEDRQGVNT